MSFYILEKDGSTPISDDAPMQHIHDGKVVVFKEGMQKLGFFDQVVNALIESVSIRAGHDEADAIRARGIQTIHEYLDGEQIYLVYRDMRKFLLPIMPWYVKQLCEQFLGVNQPYINANSLIRIFVPHQHLRDNYKRFGREIGKLNLHGPHHDFYQNVALNAVNLWMAVGPVRKDNGMSLYTDCWGKTLPMGEDHVASDQYLGRPVNVHCEPGDIILFHSHLMHSSVLNSSDESRIALTNRFVTEAPAHPNPEKMLKYLRSELIRPDGYDDDALMVNNPDDARLPDAYDSRDKQSIAGWQQKDLAELADGEVTAVDAKTCAVKIDGEVHKLARRCPHIGADMSLGYVHEGKLHCPWHNLAFDPKTGKSSCEAVANLRKFDDEKAA